MQYNKKIEFSLLFSVHGYSDTANFSGSRRGGDRLYL